MAITADVLNSTYGQWADRNIMSFQTATPFMRMLQEKALITKNMTGTYIERPFMSGSPGTAIALPNGTETYTLSGVAAVKKLQLETARFAGGIPISGKALSMNDGPEGVLKLIKQYPVAYLQSVTQDLESRFLVGSAQANHNTIATGDLLYWVTLNGNLSTGLGTGNANGVLDYAAPSAQTDSVFGLAKDDAYEHVNQYGDATNWATNGMSTLRSVYRQCAARGLGQGPDLIYPDFDTFGKIDEFKLAQVRTKVVEDKTETSNMLILEIGPRAQIAYSIYLDRSHANFGGNASDGIVYLLDTDFWELVWREMPNVGKFESKTADQDVLIAKFLMDGNAICNKLAAQGVVTGTGT